MLRATMWKLWCAYVTRSGRDILCWHRHCMWRIDCLHCRRRGAGGADAQRHLLWLLLLLLLLKHLLLLLLLNQMDLLHAPDPVGQESLRIWVTGVPARVLFGLLCIVAVHGILWIDLWKHKTTNVERRS